MKTKLLSLLPQPKANPAPKTVRLLMKKRRFIKRCSERRKVFLGLPSEVFQEVPGNRRGATLPEHDRSQRKRYRCLRSVLPYISCYVVCDTGSTDDTTEIIDRVLAGLPGEVHHIAFEDFGQARNDALDSARRSALGFDYLLLIDADMELQVNDGPFPQNLTAAAYLVRQVAHGLAYDNIRLLARGTRARYVGATHEYLELDKPGEALVGVQMLDHACGSSRGEKTERDLALLERALQTDPDDARSLFYLAQTLREAGRHDEAITAYQRRIRLGGWEEEVWYSLFMLARCYQALGRDADFLKGCLEAYERRPTRAEPLYAMANHFRVTGRNEVCALFCELGLSVPQPEDRLFIEQHVYTTGFRHELSICGYYCLSGQRQRAARQHTRELSVERATPPWIRDNTRSNWVHYARSLEDLCPATELFAIEASLPPGYSPCNPSLAVHEGKLWCTLRTVNYRLQDHSYLVEGDGVIRTRNYLLELDWSLQTISAVPIVEEPPRPEHPAIDGLEDIRLTVVGNKFRCSATVADSEPGWRRRMTVFELQKDGLAKDLAWQKYEASQDQKNWVPFVLEDRLGFIYWTDPTVVLLWDDESRQALPWQHQECRWALEHLRGSSGAIPFDGGWLYVTHEVSWSEQQRTYLHRFVHLDRDFRVQSISEPFYFRKLGIEFCCGLAPDMERGRLLLSFGVEDSEAWIASVTIECVWSLLHFSAKAIET